jgi:chromosome segregation ATPase
VTDKQTKQTQTHKIATLEHSLKGALERQETLRKEVLHERDCKAIAEKNASETRKQFDDLKQRLHAAEMENQRLRGYVARVQEDDVVREELVVTGDPDGERQMVPKRKPMHFERPSDFRIPWG